MARSPNDHYIARPRMIYGDGFSSVIEDDVISERHLDQHVNEDRLPPPRAPDTPMKVAESSDTGTHIEGWTSPCQKGRPDLSIESVRDTSAWNESPNMDSKQMSRTLRGEGSRTLHGESSRTFHGESSRRPSTSDVAGSGVPHSRMPLESRATLIRSFSRKQHAEIKTPVEINKLIKTPVEINNLIKTPIEMNKLIKTPVEIISRQTSRIPNPDSLPQRPATSVAEGNRNQYLENVTRNSNKHISAGWGTPNVSRFESRAQIIRSRKSKQDFRHISRRGSQAWSTSYYHHCDIVDDNLLISASKLDSTLIRLFSNTRSNKDNNNQQNPATDLMPFLNYAQSDLISMDPVMWRVYPMDAAQRETLDQELPYMEDSIAPKDVMTQLFKNDILTHMDYNQLVRTEGQGDRAVNRLMVKTLQRRGDKAYPAFLEALQAHNYTQICHRLAETERHLRNGMIADNSDYQRSNEKGTTSTRPLRATRTTPFINLGVQESNEIVSPLRGFLFSANQQSSLHNDLQQTSQEAYNSTTRDQALLTNPLSSFDGHVTYNQPIIDSEKLERQLKGLLAELEALQEVVAALKSAPSPAASQTSGNEVESTISGQDSGAEDSLPQVMSGQDSGAEDSSPQVRSQNITLHKRELDDIYRRGTQKSGSCSVL